MGPLDGDRWRILSPYLDHGLDLSAADRAAWLAELRAEDTGIAADVEALLVRHDELNRDGFLSSETEVPRPEASLAGLVVGAYTLRTPLGQGGMGTVWLAGRSDGRFEGTAAVKLLNASLIGAEGEARFKKEGSVLARLRHPRIAQLIDAGVSPLGQPYLVLEHVDGLRIDRYVEEHALSIEARLLMFLDVLEAVAFAHANLIVHRDIKPGNVLVTKAGQVKLLDFGIAKLLEPEGADPVAAVTHTADVALTPLFAAPEQFTGGSITTATDVYALGVMLYLLLTGRHPAGSTDRSHADWIKAVVDTTPLKPSIAIGSDAPRKLARALDGDLDNILLKALEKRPEARYPSVESFADDLRRHLRHEPVSARPGSIAYRTLTFVRRHRVGVAAVSTIVALAIGGAVAVFWQAREAALQRDAARTQLGRATAENEFTTYLLSVAAPGSGKFTVGELLEQGEALVDKQFKDDDAMRAELLTTIGRQYYLADRFEKATAVLERAAAVAERTGDPAIEAGAYCPLALMKIFNDDEAGAEALMAKALGRIANEPRYALQRADCLIQYANFGVETGEAEPMIARAREALAILDTLPRSTQLKRLDAQLNLAYGLSLGHRLREADVVYEDLVKGLEAAGRGRTIAAADAYNEWAIAHFHDDLVKEEPLLRHALELRRSIDAEGAVAPSYTFNLACAVQRLGRYDEAEALHLEAIRAATQQGVRGMQYTSMMELAEVYLARGDVKRAVVQLASVEPHRSDPLFPQGQREARYAFHRGSVLAAQGDPASARSSFLHAIELFDKEAEKITNNVDALIGLSRAEQALGHRDAAFDAAARALSLSQAFAEPGSPSFLVGLSLLQRGNLEREAGKSEAARATFKSAAENLGPTLGNDHPSTREALEKSAL